MVETIKIKRWTTNTRGVDKIAKEVIKDAKKHGIIIKVIKVEWVGDSDYKIWHQLVGGVFKRSDFGGVF